MRGLLVGNSAARARLRVELDEAGLVIAAEFDSLADAHAASVHADAIVVADESGPSDGRDRDAGPIVEALTPREFNVLELLADGLSNKSIAGRLRTSDPTVTFHVATTCAKRD